MGYFALMQLRKVLEATLQAKPNILFLPQPVEDFFVALKKPSPICFPSLLLSGLIRFFESFANDSYGQPGLARRLGVVQT